MAAQTPFSKADIYSMQPKSCLPTSVSGAICPGLKKPPQCGGFSFNAISQIFP
jgi:hypothetical protein